MPFNPEKFESVPPTEEERKILNDSWSTFYDLYNIKTQPLDILGGRTLQTFWDESNQDYAVITDEDDPNDPVKEYSSSISRDKTDEFIGQVASQLVYPSVTAQNNKQEIDHVVSRFSRPLLGWLYDNDGYPSESGHQKMTRCIHKGFVEGTMHVMDIVTEDGLESELVPNEEIFIPNFWQPDIQKQGVVMRAKLNVTYDEAQQVFGHMDKWKRVSPMSQDTYFTQRSEFKQFFEGILDDEYMQIIYIWTLLSPDELKKYKKEGKVKKWAKQARFFQVIINDVPMYDKDNLMVYHDGFCPITKGIFAKHSKPEFYWGNSLPNKIQEDKHWIDYWKTLIRYKAKLNAMPPLISKNGFIDEEILVPAKVTPMPDDVEISRIDGVGEPVNQSDVKMMEMAEAEVNRGARAPQTQIDPSTTARAAVIQESNAKINLNSIVLELMFFLSARTYPILIRSFQLMPRKTLSKISIPEQTLKDGRTGTLEVLFEDLPDMTAEEYIERSFAIRKEEKASAAAGKPKNKVYINPEYLQELNLFIKFEAGTNAFAKDDIKTAQFNRNTQLYLSRPDLFNPQKVARNFVRHNRDDEDMLADGNQNQPPALQPGQAPPTTGATKSEPIPEPQRSPDLSTL